jgi:DNA-binding GntR family transcriptional regulator
VTSKLDQSTPNASLAERVYTELLQAINDGRCRPGDRILEADVAQWLQVSRTPVREALRRLQSEDVLAHGTQGLVVVEIEDHELLELYDFRESLEVTAAAWAARNATAADNTRLAQLLKKEAALGSGTQMRLPEINRAFHRALAGAAHNRFLSKTLNSLQDAFLRLPSSTFSLPGRPALALEEHHAIVDAIARKDAAGAARAARQHIRRSRRDRLQLNRLIKPVGDRPAVARIAARDANAVRSN